MAVPRRIPDGDAQAIAVKNVLDALERTGRLAQDAPGPLEGYLRERWRVRCRIEAGGGV